MSQVNGPSMPPAHGGGYQPGSRVSPVQGQHYTQSNSQAHGGNYQPGQQHGQTVPIHQAPGPAQGRMPAAPHGVNAHQTFWQQQPQHPQQPNFIPNPIQPNSGYNPANQVRVPCFLSSLVNTNDVNLALSGQTAYSEGTIYGTTSPADALRNSVVTFSIGGPGTREITRYSWHYRWSWPCM